MQKQYTVVFSAWRTNNDLFANMEASKAARQFLNDCGLPHWDAIGSYKEDQHHEHTQEVSHIVHCDDEDDVLSVMTYACTTFNQDCVLVIKSSDNAASLENPSESIDLGELHKVTKEEAHKWLAYTYFLGEYYVCH